MGMSFGGGSGGLPGVTVTGTPVAGATLVATAAAAATWSAAPAKAQPADPATTVSLTLVMAGFGFSYTPKASGLCEINVSGEAFSAGVGQTVSVGARFGTGAAPVNGAAVTGTRFGSSADPSFGDSSATIQQGFAFTDVLALVAGTTYWFDLAYDSNSGTTAASLHNVSFSIAEL